MKSIVIKSQQNKLMIKWKRSQIKSIKKDKRKKNLKKKNVQVRFDMVRKQENYNIVINKHFQILIKQERNCLMLVEMNN